LIILDGYDELLQASGKVFSSYLMKVQGFQQRQNEQKRPVRVIVTSRITLIDKAEIPLDTTILRLLEFDKTQINAWIQIWNQANTHYFSGKNIKNFSLPNQNSRDVKKIEAIAEQPLLLLMLALYDSQSNELHNNQALDRTRLYDNLLRRFVDRERSKDDEFNKYDQVSKNNQMNIEMKRLGVAALGMYNRRKVHILTNELNNDLKFFELEREQTESSERALTQGDLLLGSFFFIHQSKSQQTAGTSQHHEYDSAFEFLHNTFGEFLTADFILRSTFDEAIDYQESNDRNRRKTLDDANGFKTTWLACLIHTPLFTRPVVLEMMCEWSKHILQDEKADKEQFIQYLDTIIYNQIERLLDKKEMPPLICNNSPSTFKDYPLLGHIAIYSINLILLRLMFAVPFIFSESKIMAHEDGTRPWDRLIHIWRSWFSLDNLNGLTAIMQAQRKDTEITISLNTNFQVKDSYNRLRTMYNVALTLADNAVGSIAGVLLLDPYREDSSNLKEVEQLLNSEQIDLELQIVLYQVYDYENRIRRGSEDIEGLFDTVKRAFKILTHKERFEYFEAIALSLRHSVAYVLNKNEIPLKHLNNKFRHAFEPEDIVNFVNWQTSVALIFYQIAQDLNDWQWMNEFKRYFMRRIFDRNPREFLNYTDNNPAFLQLIKQIDLSIDLPMREEFAERFFHPLFWEEILHSSLSNNSLVLYELMKQFNLFNRMDNRLWERVIDDSFWHRLLDTNPANVLSILKIIWENDGKVFIRKSKISYVLMDRIDILQLININPEIVLDCIPMLKELGIINNLSSEIQKFFNQCNFYKMLEMQPKKALVLLQITRELNFDIPDFNLQEIIHPRQWTSLIKNYPDLILNYLNITENKNFLFDFKIISKEFLREISFANFLQNPSLLQVSLKLAKISDDSHFKNQLSKIIGQLLKDVNQRRTFFEKMPIACLEDLVWLLNDNGSIEVKAIFDRLKGLLRNI
jgi:hypothetical protein